MATHLRVGSGGRLVPGDSTASPHAQVATGGRIVLAPGPVSADPKGYWRSPGGIFVGTTTTAGGNVTRQRNPELLPWNAPLLFTDTPSSYAAYEQVDGSIRVPNYFAQSTDPTVRPIENRTNRLLIVQGGATRNLKGAPIEGGNDGNILASNDAARLHIFEHIFYAQNPNLAGGYYPGRAVLMLYGIAEFWLEGFEMYGGAGVAILGKKDNSGNAISSVSQLKMLRGKIKNLDGRISDPTVSGGWRIHNRIAGPDKDYNIANILQLADLTMDQINVFDVGHIDNDNEAGNSRLEDAIAAQRSGGSDTKEMLFHDLLMRGAYVYDPSYVPGSPWYGNNMSVGSGRPDAAHDEFGRFIDARGFQNSGGHGLTGDGIDRTTPLNRIGRNIRFLRFISLDTSNYGLSIGDGHDCTIEDGVALRSPYVHNLPGVKIPTKHLPIQLQCGSWYNVAPPDYPTRDRWGGHVLKNTRMGHTAISVYDGTTTNDSYFNTHPKTKLPDGTLIDAVTFKDAAGAVMTEAAYKAAYAVNNVTPAMVDQAQADQRARWAAAGLTIGCAS
jgi:hypothetical protein